MYDIPQHLILFPGQSFFKTTFRVSNSLDPDHDQHTIGPDLGRNCFQRLSAHDKSPLVGKDLIIKLK